MRLSRRLEAAGESATLALQQAVVRRRQAGEDVIDLGIGEPDFATPKPVVDGAIAALEQGFTKYTATAGIPELRDAIAQRYAARHGAPCTREWVAVTVGAKQALYNVFAALLDPGDEAIVPAPCWVSFPDQVRLCGAEPVIVAAGPEAGFLPDPQAIDAAVTPRTRLVILNSPCNPTGAVLSRARLGELVEVAVRRDLTVVFDETYEHFVYTPAGHASLAAFHRELGERMVVVNSFSKTYAMTGLRVGLVLGHPDLVRAVSTFQSHTTSNTASIAQKAALAGLTGPQDAVAHMLREYRLRRDLVVEGLGRLPGVELVAPSGAFYAFPRVEGAMRKLGVRTSLELSEHLLERCGLGLVPGSAFAAEGFLRFSFAIHTARVKEALDRLARHLGG